MWQQGHWRKEKGYRDQKVKRHCLYHHINEVKFCADTQRKKKKKQAHQVSSIKYPKNKDDGKWTHLRVTIVDSYNKVVPH